jgi:hypothetical protein
MLRFAAFTSDIDNQKAFLFAEKAYELAQKEKDRKSVAIRRF